MMHVVFVVVLVACAVGSPVYDMNQVDYLQTQLDMKVPVEKVFQDFKRVFNKTYKDSVEEDTRRGIFQINVKYIEEHNRQYANGKKTYTLAVNQFTDLHHKEFMLLYTGYRPLLRSTNGSTFLTPSNVNIPSSVDWRDKNYVTPIKNQGQCGSCWAFSTVGSVEGQHARKSGQLVSLSEQQLVDCSTANHACNGGLMDTAFKYIERIGGLERETAYPYTAREGVCHFDSSKVVSGTRVAGIVDVKPRGDENKLQEAVATAGPVSVAIDANHISFQHYSAGVYDEPSCSSDLLDHGVLVIGYGSGTQDYWLVKNSWGTSWGLSGYIKMSRNKGNQCGIASMASYPML